MALDAGDTGCTHGLSKRIHDNMLAGATGALEGTALKALAYAISTAVVAEIQANAVAVVPNDGSVYAAVSNQSLGVVPTPNTSGTAIESLSDAGKLPVNVPLGGANLVIQ